MSLTNVSILFKNLIFSTKLSSYYFFNIKVAWKNIERTKKEEIKFSNVSD